MIQITLANNTTVMIDKFFFYVPIFIPDAQTRMMFIDSIKKSFTSSFVLWTSDGKTIDTQLEY